MTADEMRAARLTLGLTQKELAARLKRHPRAVSRWEKGQVEVPPLIALVVLGWVEGAEVRS